MLPVLRYFSLASAACFLAHLFAIPAFAQAPAKVQENDTGLRSANEFVADPSLEELKLFGAQGQVIQQARAGVLLILSEDNACSNWYRSAEPEAVEKFRSLRFAIDPSGSADILKMARWRQDSYYYQPYVARTGQNVGWGSTISLNANGAFFKYKASVRVVNALGDAGYITSLRTISVGDFSGATLEARMLTMLHEYGHILDMLPVDAGVPSAAVISTHNTETVLRHCKLQIQAQAKHARGPSAFAFASQLPSMQAQPIHRGRSTQ